MSPLGENLKGETYKTYIGKHCIRVVITHPHPHTSNTHV